MSYRLVVGLLLLVAGFLYCRGPSASTVVARTRLLPEAGFLEYRDVRFDAEWGDRLVHQGDIRRIGRARYRPAPFFTHHAVVTTGDFSDPELVTVTPFSKGSIVWSARRQPEGSLVVLHFIPADAAVARALGRLDEGDCARFEGREEVDSHIRGANGAWVKLTHDNHRYLLVDRVGACV